MNPKQLTQLCDLPRPRIILLIGIPGCGKSTVARQRGWPTLSSDWLRQLLADDITTQSINFRVFATLRYLLRQRLEIGRPITCVDATSLTPDERKPYLELAAEYGATVEAVWFDLPIELCMQRNSARDRVVPAEAIQLLHERLIPPALDEGFTHIERITE